MVSLTGDLLRLASRGTTDQTTEKQRIIEYFGADRVDAELSRLHHEGFINLSKKGMELTTKGKSYFNKLRILR